MDDALGAWTLEKKEDGSCVYLTDDGCSIHNTRPRTCRLFDCRIMVLQGAFSGGQEILDAVSQWRFDFKTAEDNDICTAFGLS